VPAGVANDRLAEMGRLMGRLIGLFVGH
jgi:hypothetical protein